MRFINTPITIVPSIIKNQVQPKGKAKDVTIIITGFWIR